MKPVPLWVWFCGRCGSRNQPRAGACSACRRNYVGPVSLGHAAVVCGHCEARCDQAADYCETCGRSLPVVGERNVILPGNAGQRVEGLYFGREVALRDAERRARGEK